MERRRKVDPVRRRVSWRRRRAGSGRGVDGDGGGGGGGGVAVVVGDRVNQDRGLKDMVTTREVSN